MPDLLICKLLRGLVLFLLLHDVIQNLLNVVLDEEINHFLIYYNAFIVDILSSINLRKSGGNSTMFAKASKASSPS